MENKMQVQNTLISLAIVKKFTERKKQLEQMPARWATEKEYRELVRLRDLERRFLN